MTTVARACKDQIVTAVAIISRHRRRVGSGLPKGGFNPPVAGNGLGIPPFNLPGNPAGLIPGTQWVGLNRLYSFGSGSGLKYIYRLLHLS